MSSKVASVAQSKARKAVDPGVLSSNPSSVFDKSHKRRSSVTNGLNRTVYVEKQPVAWTECCVEYWCEKARKHMSR